MARSGDRKSEKRPSTHDRIHFPDRRDFLKLSALGAVAASSSSAMAESLADLCTSLRTGGRGNGLPGRIIILQDPEMDGHIGTIDMGVVEENVHLAIRVLTGIQDTGAAFESLFSGVHSGSTFAIKVNCIGSCCTRWEVARGVVSGLSLMLGGTYDVSQVTVFDNHYLPSYGYDPVNFVFNGHQAVLSNSPNCSSSHYPISGHELSSHIYNCDYLINIPALKSHSNNHEITVALKNHYGSCCPASVCTSHGLPGLLPLNTDAHIKDKTCLVLTDAIRATYNGGPGTAPQTWNSFPEGSPNTLFATTDPVTNDYWGRDTINAERTLRGMGSKVCSWIESASGAPYELGVSDPGQMTVINVDPALTAVTPAALAQGTLLVPNVPNPFRGKTTLRFRLAQPGRAALEIYDVSGRLVRDLGEREFPSGYSSLDWDGRDAGGSRVAAGVYLVRLRVGQQALTRRIVAIR